MSDQDTLKEKLKNMSPEELQAFQQQNCVFCQIIEGKVQSKKIYENDQVLGILDINPATAGHVLLLPKKHYPVFPLVPRTDMQALVASAKKISNAMLKSLDAKGTNIFIANGVAAGQKAQHAMMHLIPRYENDALRLAIPKGNAHAQQLREIRLQLTDNLKQSDNRAHRQDTSKAHAPDDSADESNDDSPKQDKDIPDKIAAHQTHDTNDSNEGEDTDNGNDIGGTSNLGDGEDSDTEKDTHDFNDTDDDKGDDEHDGARKEINLDEISRLLGG